MMQTIDIKSGAVSSITDTDLVMVSSPTGGYRTVPFADLMAAVRGKFSNINLVVGTSPIVKAVANYQKELSCLLNPGEVVTLSFYIDWDGEERPYMEVYLATVIAGNMSERNILVLKTITKGTNIRTIQLTNPASKFCLFHKSTDIVRFGSLKVERGSVATNWSPAPEDYDSWGGVIGYLPITYNSAKKGGAHDSDQRAERCAVRGADCVLSFGSLDTACEFLGHACEDGSDKCGPEVDTYGCDGCAGRILEHRRMQDSRNLRRRRRISFRNIPEFRQQLGIWRFGSNTLKGRTSDTTTYFGKWSVCSTLLDVRSTLVLVSLAKDDSVAGRKEVAA